MFDRRISIIVFPFLLIWLFCGQAGGENSGYLGFSEKSPGDVTLYFRKIEGHRTLDPATGDQLISENVTQSLFVWDGYYAERAFALNSIAFHLHLDANIVSATAASKIEVDVTRRGKVILTTNIYELPPGHAGYFLLDIITEEDIYPPVTFNQGDELGFYFRQVDNLNPCHFRYNGAAGRNDSYLTVEFGRPDYALMKLDPIGFDLMLEEGEILDTTLEVANLGSYPLHYDLARPQGQETLYFHDDEGAAQWWVISDQDAEDFYNVRFTPAQDCTLKSVQFRLFRSASLGTPDLMIYIWGDFEGFPGAKLDSTLILFDDLDFFPAWHIVEFASDGPLIAAHQDFHLGYTCISHSPGDALALLSDDGFPVGNQRQSSVLYGDNWRTMYDQYDVDANFQIQAKVNYGDSPHWISIGAYPDSLGPGGTTQVPLHLDATGLDNGVYKTSVVVRSNSPDRLVTVPLTLRVGQTPVEEPPLDVLPLRSSLSVNYPNPFNAGTRIVYQLGSPGLGQERQHVSLIVYNPLGQQVRRLVNRAQGPGSYSVWWDGRNEAGVGVASGVYLCRLKVGDFRQVRKMLLIR